MEANFNLKTDQPAESQIFQQKIFIIQIGTEHTNRNGSFN